MTKLTNPTREIIRNSAPNSAVGSCRCAFAEDCCREKDIVIRATTHHSCDANTQDWKQNRVLIDSDGAGYCTARNHIGITHQGESSDGVDSEDPSDDLHIFVNTYHGKRIRLSVNLQNTVLEVRKKVCDILGVPLNEWRLLSCGGKLFWDSRKLADYGMKDQGTLDMRLLMKGGGSKSERQRQRPSTVGSGPFGTLKSLNRENKTGSRRRRSRRLNLKRAREPDEDCAKPGIQCCPLCDEELTEKTNKSIEGLVFCCTCQRGFHLSCSGIQQGWAAHYNHECRHQGLDCLRTTDRREAKTRAKKTGRKGLSLQKEKIEASRSIHRWVVGAQQDDLRQTIAQISANSTDYCAKSLHVQHTGLTQEMEDLDLSDEILPQKIVEHSVSKEKPDSVLNQEDKENEGDEQSEDEAETHSNFVDGNDSFQKLQEQFSIAEKEVFATELLNSHSTIGVETGPLREEKLIVPEKPSKKPAWAEPFAEVWLDEGWVPVEVLCRKGFAEGYYLVERIDNFSAPFKVKVHELTQFGSHDRERV